MTNTEQRQILEAQQQLEITLTPLIEQRQALKSMLAELTSQVDELNEQIGGEMCREGILKLDVAGFGLTYNPACERSTLSKEKLVSLGVGTDVIKQASTVSTFAKLDVREKKS